MSMSTYGHESVDTFSMDQRTRQRLDRYEQRYNELARQVSEIGFIKSGSILKRQTACGKQNCRCHADPPQLHGPYNLWTAKVNGKTVTRQLPDGEAHLYRTWIANDRELRALIDKMREVSAKAQDLLLHEERRARPKSP